MDKSELEKRIIKFHDALREWGSENIKPYPWRYKNNSYAILISEMMLHRTNKLQAQKVFNEFMEEYPTLEDFVEADIDHVKTLLKPLGLNWRIDGIVDNLTSLWDQYREVPSDKAKLIREKKIGEYIAGATETFTINAPNTLIDTNTVRVIGRVFGLNLEGEARRRKEMVYTVQLVCDKDSPRDYYYALIDLAHEICTPNNPRCSECPLESIPCIYKESSHAISN